MTLVRTQIYLTEEERQALKSMAANTGRKQSELIREAIDQMIEKYQVDIAVFYRTLRQRSGLSGGEFILHDVTG